MLVLYRCLGQCGRLRPVILGWRPTASSPLDNLMAGHVGWRDWIQSGVHEGEVMSEQIVSGWDSGDETISVSLKEITWEEHDGCVSITARKGTRSEALMMEMINKLLPWGNPRAEIDANEF